MHIAFLLTEVACSGFFFDNARTEALGCSAGNNVEHEKLSELYSTRLPRRVEYKEARDWLLGSYYNDYSLYSIY